MATVKIFKNTNKSGVVNVAGVAEIPAGGQVSIVSDYHFPVNLANFPGVVELTAEPPVSEGDKK